MLSDDESQPLVKKTLPKITPVTSTESLEVSTIRKPSRMSKKQWFVLLCIFVLYLLLGAAFFHYFEAIDEHQKAAVNFEEKKVIEALLKEHFHGNYSVRKQLFSTLTDYCGKTVDINMSEEPFFFHWDYYHSLFFVITVVTTVGYGNLAPTTMLTRIFMIFYALIGIPLNCMVIYTLGDFFAKTFKKLHQRWKNSKVEAKIDYDPSRLGLIGQVILYLIPGFTFFIFVPAAIISVFEGWAYDVSVYYSFVTLTTIGFGDIVAGVRDTIGFGHLYQVYQAFLLFWIISGLGYFVMIITYLTHALRSKKMRRLERMLRENIKSTPRKIRGELRTLLREMLFMRVKPVYKGDFEYVPSIIDRSQSCPDLTIYKTESPTMVRKRAMSECYRAANFHRVHSDTDLDRIDKERTFGPTNDLREQTELLFKVCNALSCESLHRQATEGGIHGFSDSSILASESYEPDLTRLKPNKRRAISDIRPPSQLLHQAVNGNTWYGAAADQAISEYRKRQRAKSVFEFKKPEKENIFKKIRNRLISRDESSQDIEKQKIADNMKPTTTESPPNLYIRRESLLSRQPSQDQILEQTSIADFIRALSAISSPENLEQSENENTSPRARRHGMVMAQSRRASVISDLYPLHLNELGAQRRLSLRPAEENLLQDLTRRRERKRNPSVAFHNERRNSLFAEGSTNIPPTVQEHDSLAPEVQDVRHRKVSTIVPPEQLPVSAPPNTSAPSVPHRRFSVKPVTLGSTIVSPVQKQLQKRERTDSISK